MGTYKLEDVIKTLDMTHKKHSSGNRASLSEYYLTDWILNWSATSAQTLTYSDGTFGISDAGGVISYPINQLTGVTKITFKARRTGYSAYFDGCALKIVNGEAVTVGSYSATLGTSWTEFEVDIDNDTVDYFEAYAGGGYGAYVEIKDVVFTISSNGGGAGSGYIGNSRLSNKKMVGYNVPTSSADDTKTESVNEASATPTANKPKIGNGFARIKFLREYVSNFPIVMNNAVLLPPDDMVVNLYRRGDSTIADVYTTFDSRSDTCALIWDSVQNAYLIYRFSNASKDAFYFGSMDFITGSGGTNNSYGFNAETGDLWPTDGYGTNVGHVRFNAYSGNVTYYDLCSHFTYDGEHPVIICSKLEQRPVYLDEVYFDDYVHL